METGKNRMIRHKEDRVLGIWVGEGEEVLYEHPDYVQAVKQRIPKIRKVKPKYTAFRGIVNYGLQESISPGG
jgi:hypothetical protein